MKYSLYQVDAFASRVFAGNPAAVCPLPAWLPDAVLQAIAEENNLSETAFFVPAGDSYELRWFTPLSEVDLCGHATLASAHVLYRHLGHERDTIDFMTRSGTLQVSRAGDDFCLDLPASRPQPVAT
ncbi:MAG: PhzF family phenazine biosynthesis isomerase, partial [Rhodanobacteraceae bacterium]